MKPCGLSDIRPEQMAGFLDEHVAYHTFGPAMVSSEIYGDPDIGEDDIAAVKDNTGRLAGIFVSVVRPWTNPLRATLQVFAVARRYQGTGLASDLLATLEQQLRDRGVHTIEVLGGGVYYLLPGLDERHGRALSFFQKHGYTQFPDKRTNMVAHLDRCDLDVQAAESALAERGFMVRLAKPADRAAVHRFNTEEFSVAWAHETDRAFDNRPVSVYVAEREQGSIAGFAAYCAGYRRFGPMGTRRDARGFGIGRVTLLKSLQSMRTEFGIDRAVIPWVGPADFYARVCGATVDSVYRGMRKTVESG